MNYLYNEELTHTEIEISDKIKNNIEEASNMSIVELDKFTGVSTSKITKYCKRLGFTGFKEFSHQIKLDLNSESNYNSAFEFQKERLLKFLDSYNEESFQQVTDMILKSDKIYVYGLGPSLNVANSFTPR